MNKDYLIIELGNDKVTQQALYNLLLVMDRSYSLQIGNRVDLKKYCLKLLNNGKVFFAVNDNGQPMGLLAMYANDSDHQNAFISYIGVLPEYQGKGVSSDLMLRAFEVAAENKMRAVLLEVSLLNDRAISFYKRNGFRKESQTVDALFMRKELNKIPEFPQPLVTISCITYNHAAYIREALESFLAQKTNFPVEILINDDASTDETAKIIMEYEKKYPENIFPIYQTENQYSKGIDISRVYQFPRARGKYIAICEGDDYWIDPLKLQKQVDIFNQYPDTIICGARAKTWSESKKDFTITTPALDKDITCMTSNQFFYLGDWVKNCTRIIPKELFLSIPTDYMMDYRHVHYILAQNPTGTFRCLDGIVAVYREHSGGVFSGAKPINVQKEYFESARLVAKLYDDERAVIMRENALQTAKGLFLTRSVELRERVYYVFQYVLLVLRNFSYLGIKRSLKRSIYQLYMYMDRYPVFKTVIRTFYSFGKRKHKGIKDKV